MVSHQTIPGVERLDTSVPVVVIAPGFHGHGIARTLGRLGIPVYGIHAGRQSPAARSRYWRGNFYRDVLNDDADTALDWLLDLSHKIGSRPILLPTDDHSCVFLADHADSLKAGYRFPDQPPGLTRALSNKQAMFQLCKQHNLPAAETVFPRAREDVIAFGETAAFPVLLKGIDTLALRDHAGFKMKVVYDASTLLQLYDEFETPESPNIMLQEYLEGGSRTVWMFDGYFNADSDCLFGLTANMIRQYPAYTGVTSLGVCLANEEVARQTRAFMKRVGYRGGLDFGYKYDDRSGQYKAIDVNPRIGRTFRLLVDVNGMDVARALYLDMTGQPVPIAAGREGRRWVVENFDLITSPKYQRDSRRGLGDWLRSYRGVEEAFWFASDDPRPFIAMGAASLRWVVKRAFGKGASLEPAARSQKSLPEKKEALVQP